jgi:hypothetical protein
MLRTVEPLCLALGAGTACGAAAISYFLAAGIKNKLEGNSNLLAGNNPLDMMLSVGSAGTLDKLSDGRDFATKLIQGGYMGFTSDATSQLARNPGQLPNVCELGVSTLGGAVTNVMPSGVPSKDFFFGGFLSSGIGGPLSAACGQLSGSHG